MKKKVSSLIFVIFTILLAAVAMSFASKNKLTVTGAWKIVEVRTVKSDGRYNSVFPKESQAIFIDNHYNFSCTSHTSDKRSWQLSDSAKLTRFNQSIINAGTYQLKDSILTTKASFAMNPMFVGGLATFKCSFKGDTLILKGLNVLSSDNVLHPVYASGSHIVSKLVKINKK